MNEQEKDHLSETAFTERKFLSFTFSGKSFDIFMILLPGVPIGEDGTSTARVFEMKIRLQENGLEEGILGGAIRQFPDKSGYEVNSVYSINNLLEISNYSSPEYLKKPGHTSRLIVEAIRQLVLQDAVLRWTSASTLTDGGRKIYETLAQDPNLNVQENAAIQKYIVTKKMVNLMSN